MARLSSLRASAAYSSEEGEDQGSVSNMLVHYFHPGSFPESCGCGGLETGFWGMLACGAGESLVRNSWKDSDPRARAIPLFFRRTRNGQNTQVVISGMWGS